MGIPGTSATPLPRKTFLAGLSALAAGWVARLTTFRPGSRGPETGATAGTTPRLRAEPRAVPSPARRT